MNLAELKQTKYYGKLPLYKKVYLNYVEFENKQARGEWWFQQISGWFSTEKFIIYTGGLTYYLNSVLHWNISFYMAATSVVVYMIIREIVPAIPGHFDFNKKKGLLLLQNKFMATHTNINPWQVETQAQLQEHTRVINELCQKIGIDVKAENEYRDLDFEKTNYNP